MAYRGTFGERPHWKAPPRDNFFLRSYPNLSNRIREQNKEATVYVGNLDERVTDKLIAELMNHAGPVVNVHLPKDRVSQKHQGYGFVEFKGEKDADYASKIMNGIKMFTKPIRVNKASADKQKQLEIGAEVFVGNLDPMVDETALYDTFVRFGLLVAIPKVARDDAGLSKGFGFLSYATFEAADDAIKHMHGQFLNNKEISVQYAFKKDGAGKRHGDEAERRLAAEAMQHGVSIPTQPIAPMFGAPPAPAGGMMAPYGGPVPGGMPMDPRQGLTGTPVGNSPFAPPPGGPVGPPPNGMPNPLPPPPSGLPARPPPSQAGYGGPAGFMPPGFPVPPPPGFPGQHQPGAPPPGYPRR
ncbi:RNA-binding domain-containing protein [Rhizodiscina lignyota]|uniref:RNA-binding domain-containing protein n=1 Tax=Rhizodiscina lignyota TaxID=1504668 RepID=A0A9P4M0S8_9PEZI|nr:RNA-binding domain-containing protein [Rhizodiscina lignyota]